ncbi:DUF11 domain-containing protein, partial [Candidatus Uhrbacteria bacterium]|nr:DUF11 domain-containing protein [Candidatus Uhrbacteria bacterium]
KTYTFRVKARNGDGLETTYVLSNYNMKTAVGPSFVLTLSALINPGSVLGTKVSRNQIGARVAVLPKAPLETGELMKKASIVESVGGFDNAFNDVLETIRMLSGSINVIIALFLVVLFVSLRVVLRNGNGHLNRKLMLVIPFWVIFKDPQKSFETIVNKNKAGIYEASYSLHKQYQKYMAASFLATVLLLMVKVSLVTAIVLYSGATEAQVTTPAKDLALNDEVAYRLDYKNVGTGNANNVEAKLTIPALTTYVAGSLSLNGTQNTDAADSDGGGYIEGTGVKFKLGTVKPLDAGYVLYRVKVTQMPTLDTSITTGATLVYTENPGGISAAKVTNPIKAVVIPKPVKPTITNPDTFSTTSVRWNFTDNSDNEVGFKLLNQYNRVIKTVEQPNLGYIEETGLTQGIKYIRKVAAYNSGGISEISEAESTYTQLEKPAGLDTSQVSPNSFTLDVSGVVDAKGTVSAQAVGLLGGGVTLLSDGWQKTLKAYSDLEGYYFENVTTGENSGWIKTSKYTFKNLAPSTTYQVHVKTRNGDGVETPFTDLKTIITPATLSPVLELTGFVGVSCAPDPAACNEDGKQINKADKLTYRLDYKNTGGSDANNVAITNPVGRYIVYDSGSAGVTYSDGVVTFNVGKVAAGQGGTITFTVALTDDAPSSALITDQAGLNANELTESVLSNTLSNTVGAAAISNTQTPAPDATDQEQVPENPTPTDKPVEKTDEIPADKVEPTDEAEPGTAKPTTGKTTGSKTTTPGKTTTGSKTLATNTKPSTTPVTPKDAVKKPNSEPILPKTDVYINGERFIVRFNGLNTRTYEVSGMVSANEQSVLAQGLGPLQTEVTVFIDNQQIGPRSYFNGNWQMEVNRNLLDPSLEKEVSMTLAVEGVRSDKVVVSHLILPPIPVLVPPSLTQVSKTGNQFTIAVSGRRSLQVAGEYAFDQATNTVTVKGESSEPDTSMTMIFNGSVWLTAVSDENRHWQTSVTTEQLGLTSGLGKVVSIDGIISKGSIFSERVTVGTVGIDILGQVVAGVTQTVDNVTGAIHEMAVKALQIKIPEPVKKFEAKVESPTQAALVTAVPVIAVFEPGIFFNLANFRFILFHFLSWFGTLIGLMKRRKPWGVVYDGISKEPVALAVVRLFKMESASGQAIRKLAETQVTDGEGRYGFLPLAGEYVIEVAKPEYVYPSVIVGGGADGEYENVYHGATVSVKRNLDSIIANLPIDPLNPTKKVNVRGAWYQVKHWLSRAMKKLSLPLTFAGILLALAVTVINPTQLNLVILGVYLVFTGIQFLILPKKVKPWDIVFNSLTLQPLALAAISVIDATQNRPLKTRLTDYQGRYSFLPPPGKYQLMVKKEGYKFPSDKKDIEGRGGNTYFGGDFDLKKKKAIIDIDIPVDPL